MHDLAERPRPAALAPAPRTVSASPAAGAPPAPPTRVTPSGGAVDTGPGRRRTRRLAAAGLALVLMLGGGASGALVTDRLLDDGSVATAIRVVPAATGTIDSLSTVVSGVSASVVTVTAATADGTSLGSGIVLDADGLIVTNAHVVSGGNRFSVQLTDGRTASATLVGSDAAADIALLRADGLTGLTPAVLGSDATLRVGDAVLAFGSPLGLAGTVTSGIVSALDRSVDDMTGLIQTDAAINHGNSGGALVDTAGRVVGINVAIATTGQDEGSIGLGFAIGVDTVRGVVDRLTRDAGPA
ncbi:S1C family serine protease [Micromonospora sp. NPDC051300]|uniref:S1C family serine protease n=1 Tax=Micromonospora sp. NPDC051300 TaxID=3364286 RepID=UPI0037A85927